MHRALQLVGELSEHPLGSTAQRYHLLTEASKLIGAQVSFWFDIDGLHGATPAIAGALDRGWGTERERQSFINYLAAPEDVADPTLPPFWRAARQGGTVTCARRQLISSARWYRSAHVEALRRPADLDQFIYSAYVRSAPRGSVQCLAFHRPWGAQPFEEGDRVLINGLHAACARILDRPTPPAFGHLSQRQRQVLNCLLRGMREKEVAAELGISLHTVHEHVMTLYRRLGVTSRGELWALVVPWRAS